MSSGDERTENDFLGPVKVPAGVLYGGQTQRALNNFPLAGERSIGHYPTLIQALLQVKWAAAEANQQAHFLDKRVAQAIIQSADDLSEENACQHFPVHRLHGGGGTSANMNANEVLANASEERLGGQRGEYRWVHPNDHVNLHQSSNDVYPTACRMGVISQWPHLSGALERLRQTFQDKALQFCQAPRIARTCLQDAVPVTFGDLFGSYEALLDRSHGRIAQAVEVLHTINLGGTIVGRAVDVPDSYRNRIVPALQVVTRDIAYHEVRNLFDAAQNPDDLVAVSSALELLAKSMIKIAKDLRLLSSGPETGLGEIRLPAVQPGSSIMPGKVNPVIPEFVIQSSFQVVGNHTACSAALDHGELDLNVWESVTVFNILDSMQLLSNATIMLAKLCVQEIVVVEERGARNTSTIIPRLTDLMKSQGYSAVSQVCQEAGGENLKIQKLLEEKGWI